jgi:hypothetical protein
MRTLDVHARLAFAAAGVAVLRALQLEGAREKRRVTMTYGDFANAIGLMQGDGGWKAWHKTQINQILYLMSAAQGKTRTLEFELLHDQKGRHGKGLRRKARIVKEA